MELKRELYDDQEWEFLQEFIQKHDSTPVRERRKGWLEENRLRFAVLHGRSAKAKESK